MMILIIFVSGGVPRLSLGAEKIPQDAFFNTKVNALLEQQTV